MTLHPVWYAMLVLLGLGVAGMAAGSRGKPKEVQRERLGKTISYGVIVSLLMWLALRGGLLMVAAGCAIVIAGAVELWRVAATDRSLRSYQVSAAILYLVLCAGFVHFLIYTGPSARAFVFLTVFCFDSFSQVAGQMFGKRPLAPKISPNKTVEGFLGGLVAVLAAEWLVSRWSHLSGWPLWSLLIACSSLAGDLAASHFKRRHGIKDFSNWVPYQGGFLDRFDSLIASGAAVSLANLAFQLWRAVR